MENHHFLWVYSAITGWWLTYPSEKYSSMGRISPYIMENKSHLWNHQPEYQPELAIQKKWDAPKKVVVFFPVSCRDETHGYGNTI